MHTATTLLERTTFWPVLQALSSPGWVFALTDNPAGTPAILQLLGCLMDRTTTFATVDGPHLDADIIHHTGSRPVPLEEADWVIAARGRTGGRISCCRCGTPDKPHRAACALPGGEPRSDRGALHAHLPRGAGIHLPGHPGHGPARAALPARGEPPSGPGRGRPVPRPAQPHRLHPQGGEDRRLLKASRMVVWWAVGARGAFRAPVQTPGGSPRRGCRDWSRALPWHGAWPWPPRSRDGRRPIPPPRR